VAQSEQIPDADPIREIESRQDEVLRQLDELEQRLAALLADYAAATSTGKKAA